MIKSGVSRLLRWSLLAGATAMIAPAALADELRDALIMAYKSNPSLQAARAQQRATDEGVPIARAAGLPSLSGTATYTEFTSASGSNASTSAPDRNIDAGAALSVPIYAGGGVKNSIRAAETRVLAGRSDLRGIESQVFTQAVTVYMDVILAQEVVKLNRANVQRLEVNLQATRDRFEIGDLTRTDVAQSESRLALARGQVRSAEANLIAARERYIQIVGKEPENLAPPPPLAAMPANADDAVAFALDHNPDLLASRDRAKAAGYDVKVAGASRMPRVSVFANAGYTDYLGTRGGVLSSSTLQNGTSIERSVISAVRSAYAQWQAAQSLIASSQTAVDAANLSLEGVRAENTVGNRTIIDILNAENELLNAQVQLETAKRNAYVAGFNLLAAMGRAEARDLGLDGGTLYDPVANYERVDRSMWDWSNDPDPTVESTRTVDTKAQDGSVGGQ